MQMLPPGDEDRSRYQCQSIDVSNLDASGKEQNSILDNDSSPRAASPPICEPWEDLNDSSSEGFMAYGDNTVIVLGPETKDTEYAQAKGNRSNQSCLPEKEDHLDIFLAGFQELFGLSHISDAGTASAREVQATTTMETEASESNDSKDETSKNEPNAAAISDHEMTKEATPVQPDHRAKSEEASEDTRKLNSFRHKQTKDPQTTEATYQSSLRRAFGALRFELHYVGLASATLVCYALAHIVIYELIYALLLEMTEMRGPQNLYLLYSGLMFIGLAMLRSTGFLWTFLTSKRYRQTKSELKERRKQNCWDARLQDWLEDRTYLRTTVEVVGFYLCCISLEFFWNKFLTCFVDQSEAIYEGLPSVQCQENETCQGESKNWEVEDYEYIYRKVAKSSYYQYSGSIEAPLFSAPIGILVYTCAGALSIYCLFKTGLSFADTW